MTPPPVRRLHRVRALRAQRSLHTVLVLSRHRATYRQLDYWANNGRIDLGPRPGTGNWRILTAAEMCAVLDVIDENQRLINENEHVRCGDFYRERLMFHVEHDSDPFDSLDMPAEEDTA